MFIDPNANTPKLSVPMLACYRKGNVQYIPAYVEGEELRKITANATRNGLSVVLLK